MKIFTYHNYENLNITILFIINEGM